MKSLEFPLQTALRIRKRNEDLAHRKFAAVQREYHAAEKQLRHYQRVLGLAEDTAQAAGQDDVGVLALLNYDGYRQRMERLISHQAGCCQQLRSALSQARRGLMEACRERQTLQLLRENRYQEYLRELAESESRALDETGATAYDSRPDDRLALDLRARGPREAS